MYFAEYFGANLLRLKAYGIDQSILNLTPTLHELKYRSYGEPGKIGFHSAKTRKVGG